MCGQAGPAVKGLSGAETMDAVRKVVVRNTFLDVEGEDDDDVQPTVTRQCVSAPESVLRKRSSAGQARTSPLATVPSKDGQVKASHALLNRAKTAPLEMLELHPTSAEAANLSRVGSEAGDGQKGKGHGQSEDDGCPSTPPQPTLFEVGKILTEEIWREQGVTDEDESPSTPPQPMLCEVGKILTEEIWLPPQPTLFEAGKILTEEIWREHASASEAIHRPAVQSGGHPTNFPAPQFPPRAQFPPELSGSPPSHAPGFSPQPSTVAREISTGSGILRIRWTVDAHKLDKKDKQAVSPPFNLSFGDKDSDVPFKLIIYPKNVSEAKGGASFRKAKGRGFIQLKCEGKLVAQDIQFMLSVGHEGKMEKARGPVSHNFSQSAVCGLPKQEDEWDFNECKDNKSKTFVICLEITKPSFGS